MLLKRLDKSVPKHGVGILIHLFVALPPC
jgi:hypothetical protein